MPGDPIFSGRMTRPVLEEPPSLEPTLIRSHKDVFINESLRMMK